MSNSISLFYALLIGFVIGILGSKKYWSNLYDETSRAMAEYYRQCLRDFGIVRTAYDTWEMHDKEGIWIKKEIRK